MDDIQLDFQEIIQNYNTKISNLIGQMVILEEQNRILKNMVAQETAGESN